VGVLFVYSHIANLMLIYTNQELNQICILQPQKKLIYKFENYYRVWTIKILIHKYIIHFFPLWQFHTIHTSY